MNVTFQDSPTTTLSPCHRCRQYVEQLRKFVQSAENPSVMATQAGSGLTDIGFVLIRLKDYLLTIDPRTNNFPNDFASKQHNGLMMLIKTVVVFQGIVNMLNNKSQKFASLLNRKNSAANIRRKASISEADCMECIKLLLEKSINGWSVLLEGPQNLEVIIYSTNSPQLDSKCYSLEILLALLDQPHGFEQFFRALSVIAARTGDFVRFAIVIAQLKHGLHTSKLHIQILIVRLMNKLLMRAPTQHHRMLTIAEAGLAHFSADYIEKLINSIPGSVTGTDVLLEELAIWRNLSVDCGPASNANSSTRSADSFGQRLSYDSSDEPITRARRPRTTFKTPQLNTSVVKNIERQRFRRHGENPKYYANENYTLTKNRGDPQDENIYASRRQLGYDYEEGRMRRVKSESAMEAENTETESYGTSNRRLKRFGANDYSDYASVPVTNVPVATKLSRSTHDLSRAHLTSPRPVAETRAAEAPAKFFHSDGYDDNLMPSMHTNNESATLNRILRRTVSPSYSYASSGQTERPLPGYPSSQLPPAQGGFSYLFPNLPVIDCVTSRSRTPESGTDNISSAALSPFGMTTEKLHPIVSPGSRTKKDDSTNNVVYIPINMVEKSGLLSPKTVPAASDRSVSTQESTFPSPCFSKKFSDDSISEKNNSKTEAATKPSLQSHKNLTGTVNLGEDVRNALREFDYLNDYDVASVRSNNNNISNSANGATIYHF